MVTLPEAIRRQYPFQSRWFDRGGGVRLHYVDEGSGGVPVVMVHGNPTWSFYYRRLASDLSPSRRVIVPDHVGMGLSDKPAEPAYRYTLDSRVDDFGRLLDHLKLGQVDLVVHDWGGMIGMAWATRDPGRVRRLVLLNTSGFLPPPTKALPWQLLLARTALGTALIRGANLFSRGAVATCCTWRPMTRDIAAGYLYPYRSWGDRLSVLRFVQDIPVSPADPAWETCRRTGESLSALADKPALVLWGARDFVFDDDFLAEWRRRLPRAEVHRFAKAGHYVLEDAYLEARPLIAAFLDR